MTTPHSSGCQVDLRSVAAVAAIAMDRPDALNAFNETLLQQLHETVRRAIANQYCNTICVCGTEAAFMSGADLPFFVRGVLSGDLDRLLRFTRSAHELQNLLAESLKPSVAWVQGMAFGAGLELALACQRIVSAPSAKFSLPETGLGIYPGMGGTQRLPRRIGVGLAKWMIYTGATVPAQHALEIGLIDAINSTAATAAEAAHTPSEVLPNRAEHFASLASFFAAHSIAELIDPAFTLPSEPHLVRAVVQLRSKGPLALRLAEHLIDAGQQMSLRDAIELEYSHLRDVFASADARAGLLTLGKSRPKFVGC